MTKLDSQPISVPFTPASHLDPKAGRRLIVLMPHLENDPAAAMRRIWELAHSINAHVLFLSLCSDAALESSLRRQLATMSAMVRDDKVSAEGMVMFGKDWLEIVRSQQRAGDIVVCFEEQHVGPLNKPLSQILQSNLDATLYIFSGIDPRKDSGSGWLVQTAAWFGSIGIIIGFSLLQVQTENLVENWAHNTLLMLSILVECGALWLWNSLFN